MVETPDMPRIKSFVIPTSTLHCRDPVLATKDFGDDGHVLTVRRTRTISYSNPFVGHMKV